MGKEIRPMMRRSSWVIGCLALALALLPAGGATSASAEVVCEAIHGCEGRSEHTKLQEAKAWYRQAKKEARDTYLEFKEIRYEWTPNSSGSPDCRTGHRG